MTDYELRQKHFHPKTSMPKLSHLFRSSESVSTTSVAKTVGKINLKFQANQDIFHLPSGIRTLSLDNPKYIFNN